MEQKKIKVPYPLTVKSVDIMCRQLQFLDNTEKLLFDFSDVKFITPEALLLLVTTSKLYYEKISCPILWANVDRKILSYLDRMEISKLEFVILEHHFFQRYQHGKSDALIELSTIANSQEIGRAIVQTKEILKRWFPNSSQEYIQNLSTLFKETFENSIEHSSTIPSNGFCYYTLQKYSHTDGTTEIQIAVGDIGIGILGSQRRKYPTTRDDAEAIIQALSQGRSGRVNGGGGMGFANVREALGYLNGHLTIRSGKARVEYPCSKNIARILRHSISYQGTQIIFKCRA